MNALAHLQHITRLEARAQPGTLRAALHLHEGAEAAEDAIARGLRAWAIERHRPLHDGGTFRETTIVFGRNRSDALRRAATPARLGEEWGAQQTFAVEIATGWDEPLVWPDFSCEVVA